MHSAHTGTGQQAPQLSVTYQRSPMQASLALGRTEGFGWCTAHRASRTVPAQAITQVVSPLHLARHTSHHGSASMHITSRQALTTLPCPAGICCGDTAQQLFEGQSFLCLSLPRAQLEAAAQLLRLPSLFLYDWLLPAWSAALYPAMAALVAGGKSPVCFLQGVFARGPGLEGQRMQRAAHEMGEEVCTTNGLCTNCTNPP